MSENCKYTYEVTGAPNENFNGLYYHVETEFINSTWLHPVGDTTIEEVIAFEHARLAENAKPAEERDFASLPIVPFTRLFPGTGSQKWRLGDWTEYNTSTGSFSSSPIVYYLHPDRSTGDCPDETQPAEGEDYSWYYFGPGDNIVQGMNVELYQSSDSGTIPDMGEMGEDKMPDIGEDIYAPGTEAYRRISHALEYVGRN